MDEDKLQVYTTAMQLDSKNTRIHLMVAKNDSIKDEVVEYLKKV